MTALITGASSGIGASFARFLAGKGLKVILTARREEKLSQLAGEISKSAKQVIVIPADLSEEKECARLFREVNSQAKLDVLINNAGFGWYGYYHQMPWELARRMMDTNMRAVAQLTSLFLPGMIRAGSGYVINIGSIAGGFPNQGVALYSATKSFLDAFTTSLHRELRGSGVHASVMRLGPVKTEFFDRAKELENGDAVPAEKLAVSVEKVNHALWRLLLHPRRVVYVPGWLRVSRLAEPLLGGIVDRLGPLLLRRNQKNLE